MLTCLPLIVMSAVATAPLGFLAGALARGVYSFMVSYLPVFALIGTSGFFMPMDQLGVALTDASVFAMPGIDTHDSTTLIKAPWIRAAA